MQLQSAVTLSLIVSTLAVAGCGTQQARPGSARDVATLSARSLSVSHTLKAKDGVTPIGGFRASLRGDTLDTQGWRRGLTSLYVAHWRDGDMIGQQNVAVEDGKFQFAFQAVAPQDLVAMAGSYKDDVDAGAFDFVIQRLPERLGVIPLSF